MYSSYEWQYYRERHQQILKMAEESRLTISITPMMVVGPSLWQRLRNRLRRQSTEVCHDYAVTGG